ncbi:hypothetical protein HELRODRAFT_69844, partial [Helobdella robusta]|uniref:HTH La-type RNA-binding domain-containing protein n=1 Tax=Helobdella robusta TaxID=6412 RepID=T1FZY9_HELRO
QYYFGDSNLARDKFLLEQIKLDDGWVSMETLLKFNRLKQITEDPAVVVDALKKSTAGLIEISEDKLKIRRDPSKPLPTSTKDSAEESKQRTIYAKGFPLDAKLDDLMEFFEKFGQVEHVCMRRDFKKSFKGSCFVTYKTKEDADNFIKSENTKYSDDVEMIKHYK